MKRVLLDTNIISQYLRGLPQLRKPMLDYFRHFGAWDISVISYYESLKGLAHKSTPGLLSDVKNFLDFCTIHSLDIESAETAASIGGYLLSIGQKIGNADILIAGIARKGGFILITDDNHFSRIPGLHIENWTK